MRTVFLAPAALALTLLTAPALAQFNLGGGQDRDRTRYTEEEKRNEAANEKAYRETMKNTQGTATQKHDPWFNVRPASNPSAKPQK